MKALKPISMLVVFLIIGGFILLRSLTIYIPAGDVGVRVQQYGLFGKKGVVEKDFGPGWHRDIGLIDRWVIYDGTVQTLEMTRDPLRGSESGFDDVKVQSADGYAISLDVTVKFRIMPGMAHRLYQDTGLGDKYKVVVRNEAQESSLKLMGQLKTEDFYNPLERRNASSNVTSVLRASLADNSIEVIDVLIRNVQFDPEYEAKIRHKKLADQEVELNKSMAHAEEKRGETQVIEAETTKLVAIVLKEKEAELIHMRAQTDLEVAKIRAEYERYATEKQADADLVASQKEAEGVRLVKAAEAEGERLRNEALNGPGGDVIVALEAAQNLQIMDASFNTMTTDLFDIDAMVEKLGLKEK